MPLANKNGEIAVGVPTLRHNWDVALGMVEFENTDETSTSGYDPFDSDHLYLGEPDQQIYFVELDPVCKRLELYGLLGEDGLLGTFEFTMSHVLDDKP